MTFLVWLLLFFVHHQVCAGNRNNHLDDEIQSEMNKKFFVAIMKRDTRADLKKQLKEARQKLREDIRECGRKYGFVPMGRCKSCLQRCKGKFRCSSCRSICDRDKQLFREKGCRIDRSRINELKRKLG